MKLSTEAERNFIDIARNKNVYLEGNIIKLIDTDSPDFRSYLMEALANDRSNRRKRLKVTKQVQQQNKELLQSQEDNNKLMEELQIALQSAEHAKQTAIEDLDLLQKKTQFELINTIVTIALYVIVGVGLVSTILYSIALLTGSDTTLLGNTWSNLLGILLTNSFSIVGTIMGVKYSSENRTKKEE